MRQLCGLMGLGRPFTLVAVRVIVGGSFVHHGIDKFDAGISMIEGMLTSWAGLRGSRFVIGRGW